MSLVSDVKSRKDLNLTLVELNEVVLKKFVQAFAQGEDGVRRYQDHLYVSNVDDFREHILIVAHSSRYFIHPGATKMYHEL